MGAENIGGRQQKTQAPAWAILLFLIAFTGWACYYAFVLRPQVNRWAFQYVSGYPAILHVIPIIGVPIVIGAAVGAVVKLFKKSGPRTVD
jgi:hypothetical protein